MPDQSPPPWAEAMATAIANEGVFHGPFASGYKTAEEAQRIAVEVIASYAPLVALIEAMQMIEWTNTAEAKWYQDVASKALRDFKEPKP